MTIRLDHTIVPAKDKVASAGFFAEIFGLTVKLGYCVNPEALRQLRALVGRL